MILSWALQGLLSPSWNEKAQGERDLAILAEAPDTNEPSQCSESAQPSLAQTANPQNYEQISNCFKSLCFGGVCSAMKEK